MLRGRESSNIEDRRGMGGRGIAVGGGGIGILVLALVIYLCGGDPSALLNQIGGGGSTQHSNSNNRKRTNRESTDAHR